MSAVAVVRHPADPALASARCAAMLDAQRRYGPDDARVHSVDDIAMGRALFRLLPEDAADLQPLIGGGGRFHLVADLRIDNRADLLADLAIGSLEARAMPDAAILLSGWERWGDDVCSRLVGDYAFALYDARDRRLTIARDPLGGRPLFWSRIGDRVAVASMPAGLHALPDLPRRPDAARTARMLAGLEGGTSSFFEGIERVEPGHLIRFDRDRITTHRHWRPFPARLSLPRLDDYVDAYRERLDRAAAARLRRIDPGVAAHLSGGWDSSAVVATAARLLARENGRLIAYTAVPGSALAGELRNRFSDEGPLAAAVAAAYPNVEHVLTPGTGGSPLADLAGHPDLFGRPMVNLCNHLWLADIRRRARAAGVRVVLTGEIGNFTISNAPATLLADHVRAGRWGAWARESLGALRSGRARVRGVLASSFEPWVPRAIWHRLERFASAPPVDTAALAPGWRAHLADEIAAADADRRRADFYTGTLNGIRALDFAEYHKGVLGGWGIDKRDPTADVRVVEFMLSLPPEMFLRNGVRRPLARAALADRLPAAVLDERRKGYQAADWHVGLSTDRRGVDALIARIAADPVAAGVIDVALLRRLAADWPQGGWTDPATVARYRGTLLTALSAGHFLVAA